MLFSGRAGAIQIKNDRALASMHAAGKLASECLAWILAQVQPGMTTLDIDDLQNQFAEKHGVIPAARAAFPDRELYELRSHSSKPFLRLKRLD